MPLANQIERYLIRCLTFLDYTFLPALILSTMSDFTAILMSILLYHFKQLTECTSAVVQIKAKVINSKKKGFDENFQGSALTIMHSQHINGFSLVLANFSFLQHIPQQQRPTICRFCFFILKSILLSAAGAPIPSRKPCKQPIGFMHIFTVLQ